MSDSKPGGSLTDLFRELYARIVACGQALREEGDRPELEAARAPLLELLAAAEPGAEDRFATDPSSLAQARYLMACFADQRLGGGEGPAAREWRQATLERALYQSDAGATEVFERIDRLLEIGDPGRRELAGLYLLAIALGFRGRLAGARGEPALRAYRSRLLALAAPERQGDEASSWISPTAYRHTLGRLARLHLPGLRLWGWLAAGALLLLLAVSYLAFTEQTAGVAAAVERILERGPSP